VAEKVAAMRSQVHGPVVVDAIRNYAQLEALCGLAATFHVHLRADTKILTARYEERISLSPTLEFPNLADLRANPTEAAVEELAVQANLVLDTGRSVPAATRDAVLLHLP